MGLHHAAVGEAAVAVIPIAAEGIQTEVWITINAG